MQPKPYLRSDLEIGVGISSPHTRDFILETWQNTGGSPRRLLATCDELYRAFDERDATAKEYAQTIARLQRDLAIEIAASADKDTLISSLRRRVMDHTREIMSLKRTSFQHAGLPEDVKALQEEAAAWKDQYAFLKSINTSNNAQYDDQATEITKLAASRRKWRKRARSAQAAVVDLTMDAANTAQENAQNLADLKRSNEALQNQICAESKDHRTTIELAAKTFETWYQKRWGTGRGNLAADWLAWGGVEETQRLKREHGL